MQDPLPLAHPGTTYPYGTTPTERYLARLARGSFLRLWSYPCLFRDQGGGEGKEICDLIVVFGHDVLLFSDKSCEFPDLPDLELAWSRWYRAAVLEAAVQIWGAERWLTKSPERVYLDKQCQKEFPLTFPTKDQARFHRIVVASDLTGRRQRAIGGSGSLILDPAIQGTAHMRRASEGGHPFAIGVVDPKRGFIHVLDEVTLDVVLRTLDTITDFTDYLTRKEELIHSGRLAAFGEEDQLAFYLRNVDESDKHVFALPPGNQKMILPEGEWGRFVRSPQFRRKVAADRVSYFWDSIIDFIGGHAMAKTLVPGSSGLEGNDAGLRMLARENRVRRRMLSKGFLDIMQEAAAKKTGRIRHFQPSHSGDPYYVLMATDRRIEFGQGPLSLEQYRTLRRNLVIDYSVGMLDYYPDAAEVVGIATEGGGPDDEIDRTFDLILVERERISPEDMRETLDRCRAYGWFKNLTEHRGKEHEYPDAYPHEEIPKNQVPKVGRNEPCPCGSGKKYKRCHGS